VQAEAEAEAEVLELEEHEEGMLEPRDAVGVPLAVAALLGAPAPAAGSGSMSLLSCVGSSAAGWLVWLAGGVSRVGIGVLRRWADEGFEI